MDDIKKGLEEKYGVKCYKVGSIEEIKEATEYYRKRNEADKNRSLFKQALAEVERARELFPGSKHLVLALAEESGGVVKAAMDFCHGKEGATAADIDKEIVQLVAMCVRLWEEGDSTLGLTVKMAQPGTEEWKDAGELDGS